MVYRGLNFVDKLTLGSVQAGSWAIRIFHQYMSNYVRGACNNHLGAWEILKS